jgi:hypothetical protein
MHGRGRYCRYRKEGLHIKNEHGREDAEAAFTHRPNGKKIEFSACRAAREEAGKGKHKAKTSKAETVYLLRECRCLCGRDGNTAVRVLVVV